MQLDSWMVCPVWLLAVWTVKLILILIDWRILERNPREWKELLVFRSLHRKGVAVYYFLFFLEKTSLRSAQDYVSFQKISRFQRLTALRRASSSLEGEGKNMPTASLILWRTTDFTLSFGWDDSPLKALSEFCGIKVACKSFRLHAVKMKIAEVSCSWLSRETSPSFCLKQKILSLCGKASIIYFSDI